MVLYFQFFCIRGTYFEKKDQKFVIFEDHFTKIEDRFFLKKSLLALQDATVRTKCHKHKINNEQMNVDIMDEHNIVRLVFNENDFKKYDKYLK